MLVRQIVYFVDQKLNPVDQILILTDDADTFAYFLYFSKDYKSFQPNRHNSRAIRHHRSAGSIKTNIALELSKFYSQLINSVSVKSDFVFLKSNFPTSHIFKLVIFPTIFIQKIFQILLKNVQKRLHILLQNIAHLSLSFTMIHILLQNISSFLQRQK